MKIDPTLKAEIREGTGKGVARKLRATGKVPAVVYGGDEDGTHHIALDLHDTEYLFHNIPVDNTIVHLDIDGEKELVDTLVREIQTHPWKGTVMHVDFLRIQKGVAVEMDVPVHLIGTPIGVKDSGGVLEQIIHDLPIRCIPSAIPEAINVDVTGLDVNDVMHIADIEFGEGIEVMVALERTICSVSLPRAEIEEDTEEAEEPELVSESDDDEGEGAASAGEGDAGGDED